MFIVTKQNNDCFANLNSLYLRKSLIMAVLKVIEVLSNSKESWEDATRKAVQEASKSVKNIKSVYLNEQSAVVENGDIKEFRVNVKITFEVN